ncbi:MAG: hypothetical protein KW804_01380 [Candidatus Doudnabacteria bacterium]|nr:hypothetical protein [Candidatus Doudnabacteria bacterium]
MPKTKRVKFHKIKIHNNRYLIWAIAYLLFVSIALLGYLKVVNLGLENEGPDSAFTPSHSYTDARMGFAIRYPANWSIEASSNTVSFLPSETADEGVTISITTPANEPAVRKALQIASESNVLINNTSASKLVNDLGQGHTETVVIIPHAQKLYVIRGSNNLVEKILQTFYFVKK